MNNKKTLTKILISGSIVFLVSKIITYIWWNNFAYYWYTPFYRIIKVLDIIASNPFFLILGMGWIILLISSNNENKINNSKSNIIKKIIFIICIVIWIKLIIEILLSPINGVYAPLAGFTGGGNSGTTFYGVEALEYTLFSALILNIVVPIYPLSLIYIIVFICKNKNNKKINYFK